VISKGWPSLLIRSTKVSEPEAGTPDIRDVAEGIVIHLICEAPPGTVVVNTRFSGSTEPEMVPGTSAGKPSFSEFGAGSGHLESTDGPGETIGKDKMMGYEEEEVITTK
jgi:actin-related protein